MLTADRPYASVDPGGQSVAAQVSRFWHHPRVLCGAPIVRVDIPPDGLTVGSNYVPVAAGVGADGVTPLLVTMHVDNGKLRVFDFNPDGTVKIAPLKHFRDLNVCAGSNYSFATDCAVSVRFANPFAFSLCHGLLVAFCQILVS